VVTGSKENVIGGRNTPQTLVWSVAEARSGVSKLNARSMIELTTLLTSLVVGFVLGYSFRAAISRHRRVQAMRHRALL
jgi:hypothetical protein